MGEMIHIAYNGFRSFISYGKFPGIFVMLAAATVLYLCMGKLSYGSKSPATRLVVYGGVVGCICIIPFTAAFVMIYQTRFYDYEWVFALVPITAGIAVCGVFAVNSVVRWGENNGKRYSSYLVLAALLLVLMLGGGVNAIASDIAESPENSVSKGNTMYKTGLTDTAQEYADTAEILALLGNEEGLVLYAPTNIMRYVRSVSGAARPLYGRDMFDTATAAYSFDEYDDELKYIYDWMLRAENTTDIRILNSADGNAREALSLAVERGANVIVLPGNISEAIESAAASVTKKEAAVVETFGGTYRIYDIR